MTLLSDADLKYLIRLPKGSDSKPIVSGLSENDLNLSKKSLIQPASLDLTIGRIYVPGSKEGSKGSVEKGYKKLTIDPGATVVVDSKQLLNMPLDIAAIGFPPANVAREGLIMANPGHIDPGFSGRLSFTLINMSKAQLIVQEDEPIFTMMFFELTNPASVSHADLEEPGIECKGARQETLDILNHDFMDIRNRVISEVTKITGWAAVALSALAVVLTFFSKWFLDTQLPLNQSEKIEFLSTRVAEIETKREFEGLKQDLDANTEALLRLGKSIRVETARADKHDGNTKKTAEALQNIDKGREENQRDQIPLIKERRVKTL